MPSLEERAKELVTALIDSLEVDICLSVVSGGE